MSTVDVKLPELGADVEGAKVSFWYVAVGEPVAEGGNLVQVLTDKAAVDVPSPARGTLVEQCFGEDQAVRVGQVVGRLQVEG